MNYPLPSPFYSEGVESKDTSKLADTHPMWKRDGHPHDLYKVVPKPFHPPLVQPKHS